MTGDDPTEHAVSGFALGAFKHTAKTPAHLRTRLLDGSHFVARLVFRGKSLVTGSFGADSELFLSHASSDFQHVKAGVLKGVNDESARAGSSIHSLDSPSGGDDCTSALMQFSPTRWRAAPRRHRAPPRRRARNAWPP